MLWFRTMAKISNLMVVPAGGWVYTDPDTGLKITGGDFFTLRTNVVKHRMNNGLPVGPEIDQHVMDQICARAPDSCESNDGTTPRRHVNGGDVVHFLNILKTWLSTSGEKFVSQAEADRRASICASCPKNVPVHGCLGCQNLAGVLMNTIGHKVTPFNSVLHGCAVCSCSLPALVWAPSAVLPPARMEDGYVPQCWRLSSLDKSSSSL